MHLRLDALLCDRRPRTYSKVTLGNLLAWFVTALKLQAKVPFIGLLPSQSGGFPKGFLSRSLARLRSGLRLYLAGGQG